MTIVPKINTDGYTINKKFVNETLDGKLVLFDGEKSILFTLNDTAVLILNKLKARWKTDEIVDLFTKTYGIKKCSGKRRAEVRRIYAKRENIGSQKGHR